jgi:sugar lactone lactonase YvrE
MIRRKTFAVRGTTAFPDQGRYSKTEEVYMDNRKCAGLAKFARLLAVVLLLPWGSRASMIRQEVGVRLEPVASSEKQWTGVAVSAEGDIFVNFPRWSDAIPCSVAKLENGTPRAYPDAALNEWTVEKDPASVFVCVQSVVIDSKNRLWVLDPANPKFQGVVEGGAKLVAVDLAGGNVVRTLSFDSEIARPDSYLNDVRIDTLHGFAYITDSGNGALIACNLETGACRRVLDDHYSTHAEDVTLTPGGEPWLRNGEPPRVHADGIAFDPESDTVYYQALTGRTLYRIPGAALRDFSLSDTELRKKIGVVGRTGASDGLLFGPGGKIYITAIERNAIMRATPEGRVEPVVHNRLIAWPDSMCQGPKGRLYFTTSRIHEGNAPKSRYGIYRVDIR